MSRLVEPLDTRIEYETPEGVSLQIVPAGVVVRGLAIVIDWLIRGVIYLFVFPVIALMGQFGGGLMLLLMFVLSWFYPVLFETYYRGMTPGKKALNIRVVNDDGTAVTFSASLLRNLLRVVDFLPVGYLLGLMAIASNSECKRLGDWVAGTRVVYGEAPQKLVAPNVSGVAHFPGVLARDEQVALADFSDRYQQLSKARAKELAETLSPVLHKEGAPVLTQVLRIGNGIVGRQ